MTSKIITTTTTRNNHQHFLIMLHFFLTTHLQRFMSYSHLLHNQHRSHSAASESSQRITQHMVSSGHHFSTEPLEFLYPFPHILQKPFICFSAVHGSCPMKASSVCLDGLSPVQRTSEQADVVSALLRGVTLSVQTEAASFGKLLTPVRISLASTPLPAECATVFKTNTPTLHCSSAPNFCPLIHEKEYLSHQAVISVALHRIGPYFMCVLSAWNGNSS